PSIVSLSCRLVLPFDNKGNESTLLPKGDYTLFKFLAANLESFLLNSTEAHLFRKYLCERLQKPAFVITPIFLLGNTNN
ncbi:hypothetical protein F0475_11850, partial [Prevotella sp. A2879]|nr:hypothetical protein [Prevotella vespertina]